MTFGSSPFPSPCRCIPIWARVYSRWEDTGKGVDKLQTWLLLPPVWASSAIQKTPALKTPGSAQCVSSTLSPSSLKYKKCSYPPRAHVCVYMCVWYAHVCSRVCSSHMYLCRSEGKLGCCFSDVIHLFLRQGLSLSWTLSNWLDWLANKSQGPSYFSYDYENPLHLWLFL